MGTEKNNENVDVVSPTAAFNEEVTTVANPANDDLALRIQEARKQEKDKLYPTIQKMQETIASFERREAERAALEAEKLEKRKQREAEREAEKRAQQEDEMSFKELLKTKEQEFQAQLEAERLERERAFALLEREREFQELQSYRQQRLEQERDNIMPELLDLINGNSRDEIEQSILGLKDRTAKILDSVAQAQQQSRKEMVGTRVTVPASGPLDNDSVNNIPTDIKNMSMADYMKNREKLLRSGANNRGQGLFG
jgi:membrane-associated HD superfamily phosphohydrolase